MRKIFSGEIEKYLQELDVYDNFSLYEDDHGEPIKEILIREFNVKNQDGCFYNVKVYYSYSRVLSQAIKGDYESIYWVKISCGDSSFQFMMDKMFDNEPLNFEISLDFQSYVNSLAMSIGTTNNPDVFNIK